MGGREHPSEMSVYVCKEFSRVDTWKEGSVVSSPAKYKSVCRLSELAVKAAK